MSQGKPAAAQEIKQTQLPAWVDQASQENYGLAKQVADRPFEQYQGPRVAAESPLTQKGYGLAESSVGQLNPFFDQASAALGRSTGFQDQASNLFNKASAQYDATQPLYGQATDAIGRAGGAFGEAGDIYRSTAGPLDINQFLNPYTAEVERNAVGRAEESLAKGQLGLLDKQRAAKAFGGSRGAIESAVYGAEGSKGIGDLSAQLRRAGIDFATNTALADRTGRQAAAAGIQNTGAGFLNQGAGYLNTAGGMRDAAAGQINAGTGMLGASQAAGNTASGYLNTAAGKGAATLQDLQSLFMGGQQQQQQGQRVIDAEMAKFNEARQNPVEALNIRLAALGMSPYGKTEYGSKSSTAEQQPTDWATLGLGAAKMALPFMLSDRNMKTDIKKVGDDPLAGIPIYAYRYKGDPKSYPKVVGPMAQDIEKKFPSAIKKVGRYKTIDINNLMEVLK